MITQEQAEKIRESLRANVRCTTGHDAARAIANCCIDALGGVEPLVIDGWTIDAGVGSLTCRPGLGERVTVVYRKELKLFRIECERRGDVSNLLLSITDAALDAIRKSVV